MLARAAEGHGGGGKSFCSSFFQRQVAHCPEPREAPQTGRRPLPRARQGGSPEGLWGQAPSSVKPHLYLEREGHWECRGQNEMLSSRAARTTTRPEALEQGSETGSGGKGRVRGGLWPRAIRHTAHCQFSVLTLALPMSQNPLAQGRSKILSHSHRVATGQAPHVWSAAPTVQIRKQARPACVGSCRHRGARVWNGRPGAQPVICSIWLQPSYKTGAYSPGLHGWMPGHSLLSMGQTQPPGCFYTAHQLITGFAFLIG